MGEPVNPNRAEVLAVGDELPPVEWVEEFDEVHDLLPPGADGAARRAWWKERFPDPAP